MKMPAFHRYSPEATYWRASSRCGFSTKRSSRRAPRPAQFRTDLDIAVARFRVSGHDAHRDDRTVFRALRAGRDRLVERFDVRDHVIGRHHDEDCVVARCKRARIAATVSAGAVLRGTGSSTSCARRPRVRNWSAVVKRCSSPQTMIASSVRAVP